MDWFNYIKSNNKEYDPVALEGYGKDFVDFFKAFCINVENSSILLIGTGSTETMFTTWPSILKGYGAVNIKYLEIFEGYRNKFANREYEVLAGDVRGLNEVIAKDEFDLIFWFHGPEHVAKEEMPLAFDNLSRLSKKGFVTICPYGSYYDEDMISDNVYEIHVQHDMSIEDFNSITNATFFSVGEKDASDAVIFGYNFKEV